MSQQTRLATESAEAQRLLAGLLVGATGGGPRQRLASHQQHPHHQAAAPPPPEPDYINAAAPALHSMATSVLPPTDAARQRRPSHQHCTGAAPPPPEPDYINTAAPPLHSMSTSMASGVLPPTQASQHRKGAAPPPPPPEPDYINTAAPVLHSKGGVLPSAAAGSTAGMLPPRDYGGSSSEGDDDDADDYDDFHDARVRFEAEEAAVQLRSPAVSYRARATMPHRYSQLPTVRLPMTTMSKGQRLTGIEEEGEEEPGASGSVVRPGRKKGAKPASRIAALQRLLQDAAGPKEREVHRDFRATRIETMRQDPAAPRPKDKVIRPLQGNALPDLSAILSKHLPNMPGGAGIGLFHILEHRALRWPKETAYTVVDGSTRKPVRIAYRALHRQAVSIARMLKSKQVRPGPGPAKGPATASGRGARRPSAVAADAAVAGVFPSDATTGDRVGLIFDQGSAKSVLNNLAAFFGCLAAGAVPVSVALLPLTADQTSTAIGRLGFLLTACGTRLAVTDAAGHKALYDRKRKVYRPMRGFPKLDWLCIDRPPRLRKSALFRPHPTEWTSPAYIQNDDRDSSVRGIVVSHSQALHEACALQNAYDYKPGDSVVIAVPALWGPGFQHGVLAALCFGFEAVFVPRAALIADPTIWLKTIATCNASAAVASAAVLDRTIGASNAQAAMTIPLGGLSRLIIPSRKPRHVAIKLFVKRFVSKSLSLDILCPVIGTAPANIISYTTPRLPGSIIELSRRAVRYGVIRKPESDEDTMIIQDCGLVAPGATLAIVGLNGERMCRRDEIGELVVCSPFTGTCFWGLEGKTVQTFGVRPLDLRGRPMGAGRFVRTGLLGFLAGSSSERRLFITGTVSGVVQVGRRIYQSADLLQSIAASFYGSKKSAPFYEKRIMAFSTQIIRRQRLVVVAELNASYDLEEDGDETLRWMQSLMDRLHTKHDVHMYALVLVESDSLAKTSEGILDQAQIKQDFLDGKLQCLHLLLNPQLAIDNLPIRGHHQRHKSKKGAGAAVMLANAVRGTGVQIAQTTALPAVKAEALYQQLLQMAIAEPDRVLCQFAWAKGSEESLTASSLLRKARRLANSLARKYGILPGHRIALLLPPGHYGVVAFYACALLGCVAVVVPAPSSQHVLVELLPTLVAAWESAGPAAIVTTDKLLKMLKSSPEKHRIKAGQWPQLVSMDSLSGKDLHPIAETIDVRAPALIEYTVSPAGVLAGIEYSHSDLVSLCQAMKVEFNVEADSTLLSSADSYSGLGMACWLGIHVFCSCTVVVQPWHESLLETNWFIAITKHKPRTVLGTYANALACQQLVGKELKKIELFSVKNCIVACANRVDPEVTNALRKGFAALGLRETAVSVCLSARGCRLVCVQPGDSPQTLYLNQTQLREDHIQIMERGSNNSLPVACSGRVAAGVTCAVVNPETQAPCNQDEIGELWVAAPFNPTSFAGPDPTLNASLADQYLLRRLNGHTEAFSRTGLLGFVNESSVFAIGSLEQAIHARGFTLAPSDVEATLEKCHPGVVSAAVFSVNSYLIAAVELHDLDLALSAALVATTACLARHESVLHAVVCLSPGEIPVNSAGVKERTRLRMAFAAGQLDPDSVIVNGR